MQLCKCGCGIEVKPGNMFINGHNMRGNDAWNKGITHKDKVKRKMSEKREGKNNPMWGKKHTKNSKIRMSKAWNYREPPIGKKHKESTKIKISRTKKLMIKQIQERHPVFSKVEEMKYSTNEYGQKEIQVHCKNHLCPNSKEQGGWFTPTPPQLYERIRQLEHNDGNDGAYFYCSEECKQNCPLFNLKSDPYKNIEKPYIDEEYQTFRKFVLERDNYICQFCGGVADHVHHERPQKLEPFFALDPDLAWSCCKKCHYKYGHKTGTECSTGNLANKIC